MTMVGEQVNNQLLDHLPGIYQEDQFLRRFLMAFEQILLGRVDGGNAPAEGLRETIAQLADFFDPARTPERFLPWLTKWVALSGSFDMSIETQREVLANIIPYYHRRGTKQNLEDLIHVFTKGLAKVTEPDAPAFQVGVNSQVGVDAYLGGPPPHRFHVRVELAPYYMQEGEEERTYLRQQEQIIRGVIEMEKPAHTEYTLELCSQHGNSSGALL